MKALVLADRPPKINIAQAVQAEPIDLIITLGDFLRENLLELELITSIPKIGVYGNHDSGNYMNELGIWNMHCMTWDFRGIKFGGFQGCVRYKPAPDAIMYTQQEANRLMSTFPPVDVFICHCPPRGINDEEEIAHQGFDALRTYVDQMKPKMLMHGHTYPSEENMVRNYGSTLIEYVSGTRIIEIF